MKLFLPITGGPPTYTAQQRRWTIRNGKPMTYPDRRAKRTRAELQSLLAPHAPQAPMTGPILLDIKLIYPYRKNEKKQVVKAGTEIPKTTRPDTDNSIKLIQDVMTATGYYIDDSQVYDLHATKWCGPIPGIAIDIREQEN